MWQLNLVFPIAIYQIQNILPVAHYYMYMMRYSARMYRDIDIVLIAARAAINTISISRYKKYKNLRESRHHKETSLAVQTNIWHGAQNGVRNRTILLIIR